MAGIAGRLILNWQIAKMTCVNLLLAILLSACVESQPASAYVATHRW